MNILIWVAIVVAAYVLAGAATAVLCAAYDYRSYRARPSLGDAVLVTVLWPVAAYDLIDDAVSARTRRRARRRTGAGAR